MKLAAIHGPLGSFGRPLLALGVTIIFALAVLRRSLGGPRTSAFGRHPNLKKAASFGYLPR